MPSLLLEQQQHSNSEVILPWSDQSLQGGDPRLQTNGRTPHGCCELYRHACFVVATAETPHEGSEPASPDCGPLVHRAFSPDPRPPRPGVDWVMTFSVKATERRCQRSPSSDSYGTPMSVHWSFLLQKRPPAGLCRWSKVDQESVVENPQKRWDALAEGEIHSPTRVRWPGCLDCGFHHCCSHSR